MITDELREYILKERAQGVTDEDLKKILAESGWPPADIAEALGISAQTSAQTQNHSTVTDGEVGLASIEKKPRRRRTRIVAGIAVVAILGAGLGYAYYYTQSAPSRAWDKMLAAVTNLRSGKFTATFDVTAPATEELTMLFSGQETDADQNPDDSQKIANFSYAFTGAFDITDRAQPKMQLSASGKISGIASTNLEMALQARLVDKNFYLKFDQLPNVELIDPTPLTVSWMILPGSQIADNNATTTSTAADAGGIENFIASVRQTAPQIFKITKKLSDENLNGVATHHFQFNLNQDGINALIEKTAGLPESESITKAYWQNALVQIENTQNFSGEIWIGKKDYLPYQLKIETTTNDPQTKLTSTAHYLVALSDHNADVAITAPPNPRPFDEVISEILLLPQDVSLPSD